MKWDNPTVQGRLAAVPDPALDHLKGSFQELGMHNWSAKGEQSLASGISAMMAAASTAAAPVPFREKKDGFLRLCVDPWGLNPICIENAYTLLPLRMAKGRIFMKLDLREAYYQMWIKKGDEWKTAFNCPLGCFQFWVLPFGPQGALAVFMQLINEVLHEHLYKGVLVFLNDILIFTETMEEHFNLVRAVLEKLCEAQLYVKLSMPG